jgi:hypothetical protein
MGLYERALGVMAAGRGKGGEMTQTLYAHINKIKIKNKRLEEVKMSNNNTKVSA